MGERYYFVIMGSGWVFSKALRSSSIGEMSLVDDM